MESMSAAKAAIFFELKLSWGIFLILGCGIVAVLAFRASKSNYISHNSILLINLQGLVT
jgi:hypothetical protein